MSILSTKLRNEIKKSAPGRNYTFLLKNIRINGEARGCSGFIINEDNGLVVYVSTESIPWNDDLRFMYRYARTTKDYTGSHNRWCKTLDALIRDINWMLEQNREVRL